MQRFRKIICVIEHGERSKPALERAVTLAESNQAELTVVDVAERLPPGIGPSAGGPVSQDLQMALVHEHEERLTSLIDPYRQRVDYKQKVLVGTPFLEVVREVLRGAHDLVVKCPESPRWLDRFFSGDDMHLLRKCPCPVWFIKAHSPTSYKRVLAAVDVDELYPPHEQRTRHQLNVQILELASSLAISEFAELHIAYAWKSMTELADSLAFTSSMSADRRAANVDRERQQQSQLLEGLMRDIESERNATHHALEYIAPKTHLLKGSARKEIPALANRLAVDCIVMGTVARTGVHGFFMGNTAETILEQIGCSVLAIKPQGFVTPVGLDD